MDPGHERPERGEYLQPIKDITSCSDLTVNILLCLSVITALYSFVQMYSQGQWNNHLKQESGMTLCGGELGI